MKTTVGIERERFIVRISDGKIVPAIGVLLPKVNKEAQERGLFPELFGYELFAGQIEDRTPPCKSLEELKRALVVNDQVLDKAASQNGLGFSFVEFAEDFQITELAVNPFDERHQKIWDSISQERRLAASRVAATHVHIGATAEQAVKLFNSCDEETINYLSALGDHSNGKRMAAYRIMTETESIPPKFSTTKELFKYIEEAGGERNVWDLVRYKLKTGTIEFRMFGITQNIEEILDYTRACLSLFEAII